MPVASMAQRLGSGTAVICDFVQSIPESDERVNSTGLLCASNSCVIPSQPTVFAEAATATACAAWRG
jgi:hypothetical protein